MKEWVKLTGPLPRRQGPLDGCRLRLDEWAPRVKEHAPPARPGRPKVVCSAQRRLLAKPGRPDQPAVNRARPFVKRRAALLNCPFWTRWGAGSFGLFNAPPAGCRRAAGPTSPITSSLLLTLRPIRPLLPARCPGPHETGAKAPRTDANGEWPRNALIPAPHPAGRKVGAKPAGPFVKPAPASVNCPLGLAGQLARFGAVGRRCASACPCIVPKSHCLGLG